MWNLIVKIFERRWLITILVVLITLVCSWFYQNSREEIIHKLLSMKYGGMLPSGVEITEEKVNEFMEEQILMPWIDFFLHDMLDPIFGKFLNEIIVASIFACFGLCILYTICDLLLFLEKEFEIRLYYPFRKMRLRKYPCIISKISDRTYKIESSSNAVHQLGANDFAQYMANCIIEDFVRFHELNMPTKKRNKTMRRLTNACENVLWISPRDLRKRIKIFGQFKGTLDIGHDVQIDLARFYNDIPLNITIKNCLVYSTVMKIFSIILKILFSPAILFTNLMKLIVYSARHVFQRLLTTSVQQIAASEETSDSEFQREEMPQIQGTQISENLRIDDQIEDMTTNSFINDHHLIQNDQIQHETGEYLIDFVLNSIIVIRNNLFCIF